LIRKIFATAQSRHYALRLFVLSASFAAVAIPTCKKGYSVLAKTDQLQSIPSLTRTHSPKRDERSCGAFVQDFYDWYETPVKALSGHRDRELYDADVLEMRPASLDKELYRLLKEDRDCIHKSKGICKLDFDPFFNSQDPSDKYLIKEVRLNGNRCTASMKEIRNGRLQNSVRVQPELEWHTRRWVFVNFHYSFFSEDGNKKERPDDDLLHILRQPLDEPDHTSK